MNWCDARPSRRSFDSQNRHQLENAKETLFEGWENDDMKVESISAVLQIHQTDSFEIVFN